MWVQVSPLTWFLTAHFDGTWPSGFTCYWLCFTLNARKVG